MNYAVISEDDKRLIIKGEGKFRSSIQGMAEERTFFKYGKRKAIRGTA